MSLWGLYATVRGNLRENKKITIFAPHFKRVSMRSCRRPMKCNTELPGTSCDKEPLSSPRERSFLWLRHSRDFSLFDRLMKTLISERFAKWGGNYLWFHCCAVQKRDVNKICKSRSRTKARGKHKHFDGGLFRPSEDPLNHSFSRISRSC